MNDPRLQAATRPFPTAPVPRGPSDPRPYLMAEASERARSFGIIITFLCLLVLALVPCLGQSAAMSAAVAVALLALGAVFAAGSWYSWKKRRYPVVLFRIHGLTAVLASTMIQYYLGVFSPTAVAVAFGLAFFGQGDDRVTAWAIGVGAAGAYMLLALALTAGWVEDRGVFHAEHVGVAGRLFMMFVVPVVMLLTVAQSRANLRATRELVERVADATRLVEREHGRLQEVAQELDVVRRANVNSRGHWTGRTISRFRLGGVLGRGASGEVYEGSDPATGEVVAVKLMHGGIGSDPVSLTRFEREGFIAAQLQSRHSVRVWELGLTEDGTPFLIMEKVTGRDLAGLLRERDTLGEAEVLELLEQVTYALAEAHALGAVHRDVKPGNLILADEGGWKLLDFGAAALEGLNNPLTMVGETIGTPNYMSPEQARAERVDGRSDIYSLSAVAYRALTGRPPHAAATTIVTLLQIAKGERPSAPRTLMPGLSRDVEALLAIGLSPQPEFRFLDATDLASAVRAIRAGEGRGLRARAKAALAVSAWSA